MHMFQALSTVVFLVWSNMFRVIYMQLVFSFDDRAAVVPILLEIEQSTLASLFEGTL
jgi:hypothetical protein